MSVMCQEYKISLSGIFETLIVASCCTKHLHIKAITIRNSLRADMLPFSTNHKKVLPVLLSYKSKHNCTICKLWTIDPTHVCLLLPCGHSSTCTSYKRRWRAGGLWAAGDQVAWRGRHPEGAPGSYGPVPGGMKRATEVHSLIRIKICKDPKTIQSLIKLLPWYNLRNEESVKNRPEHE